MNSSNLAFTACELEAYLPEVFPQLLVNGEQQYFIETLEADMTRVRLQYHERHLRPGGTFSGPSIMALGDLTVWIMVLARIGKVPGAVTTSLNVNFLNKPAQVDLIAEGRLIKMGRRLAVGEVSIYSQGVKAPVAHITATYSVPPMAVVS